MKEGDMEIKAVLMMDVRGAMAVLTSARYGFYWHMARDDDPVATRTGVVVSREERIWNRGLHQFAE
jgi:hypothetical protein